VGKCSSYDEVVKLQREIRKSVSDCFVIAIHGGTLIPVTRARQIENERKK
jgi:N-acetylmuramoyl-L-alanine amidase